MLYMWLIYFITESVYILISLNYYRYILKIISFGILETNNFKFLTLVKILQELRVWWEKSVNDVFSEVQLSLLLLGCFFSPLNLFRLGFSCL